MVGDKYESLSFVTDLFNILYRITIYTGLLLSTRIFPHPPSSLRSLPRNYWTFLFYYPASALFYNFYFLALCSSNRSIAGSNSMVSASICFIAISKQIHFFNFRIAIIINNLLPLLIGFFVITIVNRLSSSKSDTR